MRIVFFGLTLSSSWGNGHAALWRQRGMQDEYLGTLVNAYIAAGGEVCAERAGRSYVDVGTLHGYREAMHLLADADAPAQIEAVGL